MWKAVCSGTCASDQVSCVDIKVTGVWSNIKTVGCVTDTELFVPHDGDPCDENARQNWWWPVPGFSTCYLRLFDLRSCMKFAMQIPTRAYRFYRLCLYSSHSAWSDFNLPLADMLLTLVAVCTEGTEHFFMAVFPRSVSPIILMQTSCFQITAVSKNSDCLYVYY